MKNLMVLIGYPGAGKTTLAKAFIGKYPQYTLHDVYRYVKKYKKPDGSLINEKCTINAYKDMYQDLKKLKGDIILELGTNYPEINTENLKKISENNKLAIILCLLKKVECLERVKKRKRVIEQKTLLKKFKRNFPKSHEVRCDNLGLKYYHLDMSQDIDKQAKFLEKLI